MKALIPLLAAVAWCAGITCSIGGDIVSVRLVEAVKESSSSSSGGGKSGGLGRGIVGKGLKDVAKTLTENVPSLNQYNVLASGAVKIPAQNSTVALGDYAVVCSGTQQNLTILVSKNKKEILKTTVQLEDGKPFVVGAFPAGENKQHLLIFVVQ